MLKIEDYSVYSKANTLTENELDMLAALADADQGLTASGLAKLLGLSSHAVVNRIFGGLGRTFVNILFIGSIGTCETRKSPNNRIEINDIYTHLSACI